MSEISTSIRRIEGMASTAGHSSLPPSLSRINSPSPRTPGKDDSETLFEMSFPEINLHIDVEKEITQFVKELDANEGREEFVFRTTMNKNLDSENGNHDLLSASDTSRDWGGDISTPKSNNNVSSLKMTYYAFKETTGQKSGIPVSLVRNLSLSHTVAISVSDRYRIMVVTKNVCLISNMLLTLLLVEMIILMLWTLLLQLAAHLERKESRYPSFLGSR